MKLVSAIMPTRGRESLAAQAVQCFATQTYQYRQLVIIDDDQEPSFPSCIPGRHDRIIYTRHPSRSIAEKRNIAADMAEGAILCHFDSDDWSAPTRIADQVKRLEVSGKAVTAYDSMLFYQTEPEQAYIYKGYELQPIGTSLMFTREWWRAHPFPPTPTNVGEDTAFGKMARDDNQITTVDAGSLMVARIHPGNTSVKNISCTSIEYRPVSLDAIPKGFFL